MTKGAKGDSTPPTEAPAFPPRVNNEILVKRDGSYGFEKHEGKVLRKIMEYLSEEEHRHLLEQAVRETWMEAMEAARRMPQFLFIQHCAEEAARAKETK